MRSWHYTWEKLYATVLILADGNGTVQERLADAYESQLSRLTADDLPLDMRDAFTRIERNLTEKNPAGSEGRVAATTAAMDYFQASRIVDDIVGMFSTVCQRMGQEGIQ